MYRIVSTLGLLIGLALSPSAVGRTEATVQYTKAQVYSAALRYLRVDLAYPVTERDAEAAYLLFEYPAQVRGKDTVRGAIELVETQNGVRVFVSVPQLPVYQEDLFKRGLLKKLRSEYGSVRKRTKANPTPKKPKDKAEGERKDL